MAITYRPAQVSLDGVPPMMPSLTPLPRRGLYAVTDADLIGDRDLVACVEQVLLAGAALVQYRDKNASAVDKRSRAEALLALCRRHAVPLIVNDDVALAKQIGADGVHVGREDDAVAAARAALGPNAIVGASCYHEFSLAVNAQRDGASYIAFGRFFTSHTKPGAALATTDLLIQARAQLDVPVAAIGGITAGNAGELVAAGADFVAVIHDLWCEADCGPRATALLKSINPA